MIDRCAAIAAQYAIIAGVSLFSITAKVSTYHWTQPYIGLYIYSYTHWNFSVLLIGALSAATTSDGASTALNNTVWSGSTGAALTSIN